MGPMTQADIEKWIAENNGELRREGPDANGITTYYARNGQTISIDASGLPRMRGFSPPADGADQQPAASPTPKRGTGMTQQELEAIINGFGQLGPGDFREEVKQEDVPNPAAYDENGQYIQGTPLTVKGPVTYRTWVKPGTNQRLTVKVNPDGSYTQVYSGADASINPTKPNQTGQKTQIEGTPTPNGPDNERPRMVTRDASGKEVEARELTPAEMAEWRSNRERSRNPGGKTDAEMQAQTQKDDTTVESVVYEGKGKDRKKVTTYKSGRKVVEDAATSATATGVTYDADGTKVTKYDDGTETREQLSPAQRRAEDEATKPKEVRKPIQGKDGRQYTEVTTTDPKSGKTETHYENENGERVALPGSAMAGVKDVPSFTPDLTKPGAGIIDRQKQLDELYRAGKLTWEQRQTVLAADIETAKSVAGEFNAGATILREQYQNNVAQRGQDVTQANSRATLANQHTQNATALIEKFAPYLGVTPGDAGKMFMGMMASQLATATMYGGMANAPRVEMDPRLISFADRAVGAATAPVVPPGPGEAAAPVAPAQTDPAAVIAAHRATGQPLPAPLFGGPRPTSLEGQRVTLTGNENPNDIVTIYDSNTGETKEMTVGQWREQVAAYPIMAKTGVVRAIRPAAPAGNVPPGMMSPNPMDITQTTAPVNPLPGEPGHNPTMPVGMGLPDAMPDRGALATGEMLFGKSLPQPTSWRQDAEDRMYALTMPEQQAYGAGNGLFGASLPPALTQPAGMDFGLSAPQGGSTDPIDAEARRQLREAGVLV